MTATTVAATGTVREEAGLTTAYRLLWLAVVFDFLAFGIGFDWDRRWDATHALEDFFSPPHLFIYSMFMLGGALAERIWQVVSAPTRTGVLALTALAGLTMPALTGLVDLALRARIP